MGRYNSYSLDKVRVDLQVGATTNLNPSNATDKNIIWTSSNASVATVDNTGRVATRIAAAAITSTTVQGRSSA